MYRFETSDGAVWEIKFRHYRPMSGDDLVPLPLSGSSINALVRRIRKCRRKMTSDASGDARCAHCAVIDRCDQIAAPGTECRIYRTTDDLGRKLLVRARAVLKHGEQFSKKIGRVESLKRAASLVHFMLFHLGDALFSYSNVLRVNVAELMDCPYMIACFVLGCNPMGGPVVVGSFPPSCEFVARKRIVSAVCT